MTSIRDVNLRKDQMYVRLWQPLDANRVIAYDVIGQMHKKLPFFYKEDVRGEMVGLDASTLVRLLQKADPYHQYTINGDSVTREPYDYKEPK